MGAPKHAYVVFFAGYEESTIIEDAVLLTDPEEAEAKADHMEKTEPGSYSEESTLAGALVAALEAKQ